jgi:cytochrome bd ubiquinol oxidase subunit II
VSGEVLVAGAIWGALALYALTGGADFGGGVWDLFARGPRAAAQRSVIRQALAPIWEANHVWLIVAVVLLFTAFPRAFSAVAISLHLPLTFALVGIVLRGSAFVFRSYFTGGDATPWGGLFAVSSLVTPVALGTCVGALAAGRVRPVTGDWTADFVDPWLAPFPLGVGVFALALFSFLAAAYLTLETKDADLRDDFRRRALAAGALTAVMACACAFLAAEAPLVRAALAGRPWLPAAAAAAALGALAALRRRRFALARILAAVLAVLVLAGWGLAQFPYLAPPELTLWNAAGPASVRGPLLAALAAGFLLVAPCLAYLFYVFKKDVLS